jgi:predicted transcriptional regulator
MTLRLSDELTEQVRELSKQDGRSMQQTIIRAVEDYVTDHGRQAHIRALATRAASDYSETLRRLGE